MKKTATLGLFCFALMSGLNAQETPVRELPEAEEILVTPVVYPPLGPENNFIPQPPPGAVRTMGEWEEIQALFLAWEGHSDILVEIVRHAVAEVKVVIFAQTPSEVITRLTQENISMQNVVVLQRDNNTLWIRDFGPWAVYLNEVDSLMIADWTYNRPRPLDDTAPSAAAAYLGLPIFEATTAPYNLVHTGGNHLTDGFNTAFSSDLLFDENVGHTEAEIDNIMQLFLGVDNYVKMRALPYDGIHHLDMHMRLLDEETILFGAYPQGVADGPQIETNIRRLLANEYTAFGNRYNILTVPMPPDQLGRYPDNNGDYRTYANSIFLNKTILVPIYEEQYDSTALRIYRENLPGYNVVGIDCNEIIDELGALHCITKTVGVNNPLWIAHARLRDTYDDVNDYPVSARIRHRSGISEATLYYRTDEASGYVAVPMSLTNAGENTWSAAIPAQPVGTEVQYYIHALAQSGKQQVRPIVAPEGYFRFRVKGLEAPVAKAVYGQERTCTGQSVQFHDLTESPVAVRVWSFPGGEPATSSDPSPVVTYPAPGMYGFSLNVSNAAGSDVATYTNVLTVESGLPPFPEDFSGTGSGWVVENPGNNSAYWQSTTTTCSGPCYYLNNHSFDTRNTDDFLRTTIDLTNATAPIEFLFDVAYAPRTTRSDILRVNVIRCNGEKISVYTKSGNNLATAPATNTSFTPASCDQWRHETADLSAFAGEIILIEFENIGGYGNRVYLDNLDFIVPNIAPLVAITEPGSGTFEVAVLPEVSLIATANDLDGTVDSVEFLVNGTVAGTLFAPPYELSFLPPAFGEYVIAARATDNDGAVSVSSSVTLNFEPSVGTNDEAAGIGSLRIFPNPAKEQAMLELQTQENAVLTCRLLDVNGREIQRSIWETTAGVNTRRLNLSHLPSGIYCVLVSGQDQKAVVARKLVVD